MTPVVQKAAKIALKLGQILVEFRRPFHGLLASKKISIMRGSTSAKLQRRLGESSILRFKGASRGV